METNPYQSPQSQGLPVIDPTDFIPWRERAWRGAKLGAITGGSLSGLLFMLLIGQVFITRMSMGHPVTDILHDQRYSALLVVPWSAFTLFTALFGALFMGLLGSRRRTTR